MANVDVWPTIHAERKGLAADLEGLSDEQWATPSLCGDWTVRDVLAHMTSTAKTGPPQFFTRLIASGFKFNRMQEKNLVAERGDSPVETLRRFNSELNGSKHPPGPNDT